MKTLQEYAREGGHQNPELVNIKEEIVRRLNFDNLNFPGLFVGGPGSGKSIRALNFIESVSRDGYNQDLVIFQPQELLDLINGKKGVKLRKGDCILWDEGGFLSNRQWYTEVNIAISIVFQSFRFKNLGLMMCVPSTGYIDASVRTAFLSRVHCLKVDQKLDGGWARYYESQHHPIFGKTYNKHRRALIDDEWFVMDKYFINSPSKSVIRDYEKYKAERLDEFYVKVGEKVKESLQRKDMWGKPKDISDHVDFVLDNLDKFVTKEYKGKKMLNAHLIADACKVGIQLSNKIKSIALNHLFQTGNNGYC